ncbi:MAG: ABC transporter permease [Acidimicrobiales bacterium]
MTAVDAGAAAATAPPSGVSVFAATRTLARRDLLRARATPATTVQSVVFPAVLLMVLLAVFGSAVEAVDGQSYVQRITPALVISGAAFGSLGAVGGLFEDRRSGFFDRLRLAPVGGGDGTRGFTALLLARSASEHVRVLVTAICLVALGFAFGFRFEAGVGRALAFFVVATVCGACFGWIGFALATRGSSMEAVVPPVSALFLILLFLSHGMVPVEAFPGWVQPVVEASPSSLMMLMLQRLSGGGEILWPLAGALAWTLAITAVFGWLSLRGLTRSAGTSAS